MAKIEKKLQEIELEANGLRQIFEINHAERLLRMPNNGGWKLPENSDYTFDYYNGIELKRNTGKGTEAGKSQPDSEGNFASEQN